MCRHGQQVCPSLGREAGEEEGKKVEKAEEAEEAKRRLEGFVPRPATAGSGHQILTMAPFAQVAQDKISAPRKFWRRRELNAPEAYKPAMKPGGQALPGSGGPRPTLQLVARLTKYQEGVRRRDAIHGACSVARREGSKGYGGQTQFATPAAIVRVL